MERAKKEEGRRTRARKEQKEEERGKKGNEGGGGEGKKKRVSRWWRSRGISTRFVHAGNLSGLPSGRAFVITWAYGEHKRLGCTHVRLPRTRARACACVCVRVCGDTCVLGGGTLYQVPSMRRYKLSGYPLRPRATNLIYIEKNLSPPLS